MLPRSAQQRPCRLLARLYSNASPLCLPAFTLCLTWLPFRSIRLTGLVCFALFFYEAFPLWTIGLLPTRALEQGLNIIWVWSVARLSVRSISPMPFVYGVPPSCDTFSGGMLWILYTFFRKESQLLLYSTSFAKILHRTASLSLFLETTSSVVKRGLFLERLFIGQDVTLPRCWESGAKPEH